MLGDYELTPETLAKWIEDLKAPPIKEDDPFHPRNLEEYIGQEKAKRVASIIVQAALKDGRPLPSTMITGPFGQGKTTLARIMADIYDPNIPLYDAANVNKNPLEKGIVIIDEIHNLGADVADSLNILLDNNNIHIIGCSTNPGALPSAFRSRFRQIYLEPYSEKDIEVILKNIIAKRDFTIDAKSLADVAHRSRLNPRFALNYLAFILDIASLKNTTLISPAIVSSAFSELGIDKEGYSLRDFSYLKALPTDGRAVGLQYLSAITSIDEATILEEIEPYLLQQGLIDRTSKGRKLMQAVKLDFNSALHRSSRKRIAV